MGPEKGLLILPHAMETKETDLGPLAESMLLKKFPHSHNDALLPFPLLKGNFTDLLSVYFVSETNHFILLCAVHFLHAFTSYIDPER